MDTTAGAVGNSYDVLYSGAGQSVSVTRVGTIGVKDIPRPTGPSLLRVRRSPTTGPVEFIITATGLTDDAIEVFDITGRKVDAVRVTTSTSTQAITWDWRAAGARPGVYLARLRSGSAMTRFVLLH